MSCNSLARIRTAKNMWRCISYLAQLLTLRSHFLACPRATRIISDSCGRVCKCTYKTVTVELYEVSSKKTLTWESWLWSHDHGPDSSTLARQEHECLFVEQIARLDQAHEGEVSSLAGVQLPQLSIQILQAKGTITASSGHHTNVLVILSGQC